MFMYFLKETKGVKWSEVSYGEVLGDKNTLYIRVNLWGWLLHLVFIMKCVCFNLFCNVWLCVCMCGYFGNMYTCIYCVVYWCVVGIASLIYFYSYLLYLYQCKGYYLQVTAQLQFVIIIMKLLGPNFNGLVIEFLGEDVSLNGRSLSSPFSCFVRHAVNIKTLVWGNEIAWFHFLLYHSELLIVHHRSEILRVTRVLRLGTVCLFQ
jgi:hypothetical protein